MNRRSFLSVGGGTLAASLLARESLASLVDAPTQGAADSLVDTSFGRLRGAVLNGVHTFKGIPYGASTAGAARFMPPARPQAWTGVRDAMSLASRAPQILGGEPPEVVATDPREPMGEDCLVLNVWTPATRSGRRPVMVWLHGGGFASGSASYSIYDGKELARKHDVVVVGVNHRLNVFGFLFLADIGGPAFANASNAGILDVVAALEWVRDNIAPFGGDPGNVTIFGQSGGGGKVSTLMAMPSAKGLFHRALAQSGSNVRGISRDAANKATETLLTRLGIATNEIQKLQQLPTARVLEALGGNGVAGGPAGLQFAPVVDGKTLPTSPFDPTAPALSADIPFMTGSTSTEVTFQRNASFEPLDAAALTGRVKETLKVSDSEADRLIALYRKSRPKAANLDLAFTIATDVSNFRVGVETQAERKAAQGRAPVYMYRFEWWSPVHDAKMGAFHTLDIPFAFDNVDGGPTMTGTGPDRYALADKMSKAWVAFAKSGNPNHKGLPSWAPFTAQKRTTMVFDNDCRVVDDPHSEERKAIAALRART